MPSAPARSLSSSSSTSPQPHPQTAAYLVPPGKVYSLQDAHSALAQPGMPLEMETLVINGQPMRVWKRAIPTMRDLVIQSRARGEKDFIVFEGERMTFTEHFARVARLAHALVGVGVGKGDRVALCSRNIPEWSIVYFAATSIGAIIVPMNAWLKRPELEYCLQDSKPKVVFVDDERARMLHPSLPALRGANGGSGGGDTTRWFVVMRASRFSGGGEGVVGYVQFEGTGAATAANNADDLPDVKVFPDDDATIFYTSGTTGRPKGALGTHRNYCTQVLARSVPAMRDRLRRGLGIPAPTSPSSSSSSSPSPSSSAPSPAPASRGALLSVPLFHVTGCHAVLGPCLASGIKLVMMVKWDPVRAMQLIQDERVNVAGGVPTLLWQIMEHPDVDKYDLSSLTNLFSGGAPAAKELLPSVAKKFPKTVASNGYGLTETSGACISNIGVDYELKPLSIGVPYPVIDAMIVEPGTTREKQVGEIGEIAVRGPTVVRGYYGNPTATAASFKPGGWFLTGDVGTRDADGFITLLDRAKDMVIRGGENVYSVEVENCISSHPSVFDCAVVGIPDRVLGELVGAAVQLKPAAAAAAVGDNAAAAAAAASIVAHCRANLANFKVPAFVLVTRGPLARNANGKVVKAEVRRQVVEAYGKAMGAAASGKAKL
ncbi:long-chain-fatty-acid--CoA ligase [Zopfochytrium polystomum]|nr:long-chain-fatty-acid--CoA ligase [Zopfochytrium polystomum]